MLDNRIYLEIGDLGRRRILGNTTTIQNKEDVEGKLDIQQNNKKICNKYKSKLIALKIY